jgi:protoporphyrinogen oxidase
MELTVLGGGPAGIAVAFYAHKAGHRFRLYEKSLELGGMCRTFEAGRHRYDAGAHRFHDRDADITQDVSELMAGGLVKVAAPSKVWIDGKPIDFPPTPLNALFAFGLRNAAQSGPGI